MELNFDFGELENDEVFVNTFETIKNQLSELQNILDELLPLKKHYDEMDVAGQIELDLFLAYTMTALTWAHLRVQGVDLTNHSIKGELIRIKNAMRKWQEMQDKEKRPKVNVSAAKRFIRSGLYDPYKGNAKLVGTKKKF